MSFPDYKTWRMKVDTYLHDKYGVTLRDSILSEARIRDEWELDKMRSEQLGVVVDYRDFAEQALREYID